MEKIMYTADDVSDILSVSRTKAYMVIRDLNIELERKGYMTFQGRVSAAYFKERVLGISA